MLAKAEFNYYPEEVEEIKHIEENKKINKRKKIKKKNNAKALFKITCLICAIIIMITSLFILLRYVNITKIRMEVTQLEKEKTELEKLKMNLAADLEGVKNSLKISEDAIYKLGMSYPEEDQIVYISVDETVEDLPKESMISSRFGKVVSMFSSLF